MEGRKRVEDQSRKKEQGNKQKIIINMDINPTLSIITLNISGLNA